MTLAYKVFKAESSKVQSPLSDNINWQCDYVPSEQECALEAQEILAKHNY